MTAPRYYCPPGVERPAHIAAMAPSGLTPGAGPDDAGGVMYGGPYHPEDRDLYHLSPAGWWVRLADVTPRELLRRNAVPGFMLGDWCIPHILTNDVSVLGYWSADGFVVPANVAPLVDGLRAELDYIGPVLARHATLAADVIALNYHTTLVELGLPPFQLLTNDHVLAVIRLAAGVPRG